MLVTISDVWFFSYLISRMYWIENNFLVWELLFLLEMIASKCFKDNFYCFIYTIYNQKILAMRSFFQNWRIMEHCVLCLVRETNNYLVAANVSETFFICLLSFIIFLFKNLYIWNNAGIRIMSTEEPVKKKAPPSALKNFIAGGAGGVCLVLTGQPLDTIKVSSLQLASFLHFYLYLWNYCQSYYLKGCLC